MDKPVDVRLAEQIADDLIAGVWNETVYARINGEVYGFGTYEEWTQVNPEWNENFWESDDYNADAYDEFVNAVCNYIEAHGGLFIVGDRISDYEVDYQLDVDENVWQSDDCYC